MALACRNGAFLLLGPLPLEQASTTSTADQGQRKQVRLLPHRGKGRNHKAAEMYCTGWLLVPLSQCCGIVSLLLI